MDPVLVSVGNDFKVWETSAYSQIYSHVPEKTGGPPVSINCTSWSADTSAVASFIKDDDKILLTFYKNHKYYSHEICIQGIQNVSYIQFPRTSQNHMYISSKNELHYYDLTRDKSRKSFSLKSDISCLVSNKSDSYVAMGCKNGSIVLLTTISNQLSQPFTADGCVGQHMTCLKYSPVRAGFLGASCESGVLSFWDCNANKNIFNISDHLAPCTSFAFSPLNDCLAVSCGLDKKLICHDTKSKKSVFNLQMEHPCTSVDFDTDGATVAVGTSRGKILVYDLRNTSRASKTVQAHSGRVTALAYKPKIDKMNVTQVMSAVKSVSKSRLRSQTSGSALKTVKEEREKENLKPEEEKSRAFSSGNKDQGKEESVQFEEDSDLHFTPAKLLDIVSPVENDNFNRRESISSQLFSPLKEADVSFNTPNPSSRGSSRRTSDARLSTEGLFSPVRDTSETKKTPLVTPLTTPLASPYLSSIQEEAVPDINLVKAINSEKGRAGGGESEGTKLSLETLTEVAASVTKRAEGSPEYVEAGMISQTGTKINLSAAKKTSGFAEVSTPPTNNSRSGLVKPLSVTKSTLRDVPSASDLPLHHHQDIVRVRDLHVARDTHQETTRDLHIARDAQHETTRHVAKENIVRLRDVEGQIEAVTVSTATSSLKSVTGQVSSEVDKFFSESRVLSSELDTVTTAFPSAMLDNQLSPRQIRPLSKRNLGSSSTAAICERRGDPNREMAGTSSKSAVTSGKFTSARGSLHSSVSSENEVEGFNRRYVEEVVSEAMEDWCAGVEQRIVNMHYSLIRIMQEHQEETRRYIEEIHRMEQLKRENERLLQENEELKKIF